MQPYPSHSLRPPSEVMRLANMGAYFSTRLSFSRLLVRRLAAASAKVVRRHWQINDEGYGCAVYSVRLDEQEYSLVAFSTPLADEQRSDRVIAEAWDTTYVLYDGVPSDEVLKRLEATVPKQEAGRYDENVLVLSRANKSVRLFSHIVDKLAVGEQPDAQKIMETGYLMRTTAVYGNGKFGIADRARIMHRPFFAPPFQAELLTVWLIRGFTLELVEYIASQRGGARACRLALHLRKYLGIGNSTGLGMAPFLVNHPYLIHYWGVARETAFARVCAIEAVEEAEAQRVCDLADRAAVHLTQWRAADYRQTARLSLLQREWAYVRQLLAAGLAGAFPWQRLFDSVQGCSAECRELLISLMLETQSQHIDDLADKMASFSPPRMHPTMSVGECRELLENYCDWALSVDFSAARSTRRFWYLAQEKKEPRLGDRCNLQEAVELPMDVARQIRQLFDALQGIPAQQTIAEFLLAHPHTRYAVKRVQTLADLPYAEIRENLIDEKVHPIDMLRWKLSFFGATKFDPKSDFWVRIVLFQGAPGFEGMDEKADDWWMPVMSVAA